MKGGGKRENEGAQGPNEMVRAQLVLLALQTKQIQHFFPLKSGTVVPGS